MEKATQIGIRLPPETKSALAQAAKAETRSMSSLIEKVMSDWLRGAGYLPAMKSTKKVTISSRLRELIERQPSLTDAEILAIVRPEFGLDHKKRGYVAGQRCAMAKKAGK